MDLIPCGIEATESIVDNSNAVIADCFPHEIVLVQRKFLLVRLLCLEDFGEIKVKLIQIH
jgi:hypothetical protein